MKRFYSFLLFTSLFLFFGCKNINDAKNDPKKSLPPEPAAVKQIDMTILVPFESSSLEYFDYKIRYTDNSGNEYNVTVTKEGIIDDSNPPSKTPLNDFNFYTKTYSYVTLPVSNSVNVELVPTVPEEETVSFSFIIPKPYIYSNIYFSSSSIPIDNPIDNISDTLDGLKIIKIENETIKHFLSVYGSFFSTQCIVKNVNGIDIKVY